MAEDKQVDAMARRAMGLEQVDDTPSATPDPLGETEDKDRPTAQEQAASEGAPVTEADKMGASPVSYEVKFGDNDVRQLSPEQISSTFNRYRDLNYKQMQNKPINDVAEALMGRYGADPYQIAEEMIKHAQEREGKVGSEGNPEMPADSDAAGLRKWEEENAVSLPPGYGQIAENMQQLQQMQAQTQQMLQSVVANSQAVADAGQEAVMGAESQMQQASQQQIANNLDKVQNSLGLPDEAAQDFMMFVAERGFTLEDMVDPQIALTLGQDFKNQRNSSEFDRLRSQAERRQAVTGSIGSAPATPATSATPTDEVDDTMQRLAAAKMEERNRPL